MKHYCVTIAETDTYKIYKYTADENTYYVDTVFRKPSDPVISFSSLCGVWEYLYYQGLVLKRWDYRTRHF